MRQTDLSGLADSFLRGIGYPNFLGASFCDHRIVETHISVVIIGRELVLKFKKPILLDFLDYSTLKKRWQAACNEVALNRRLSDGVYLGLWPILAINKEFSETDVVTTDVSDSTPAGLLEVAVVMRTLAMDSMLSEIIRGDRLSIDLHIDPLAKKLASFHRLEMSKKREVVRVFGRATIDIISKESCDNIKSLEAENSKQLLSTGAKGALERVKTYADSFLGASSAEEKFAKRDRLGYVVDGHGDLRTEHISFRAGSVNIIDCIEFSESLRMVDVLSDIAFLCMDLDFLQRSDVAVEFLNRYKRYFGRDCELSLFTFYSVYRAMVRAKVEILKYIQVVNGAASNLSDCLAFEAKNCLARAERYLALASRYVLEIRRPFLIATAGVMGVGKSTLANYIGAMSGAQVLASDKVRKELFPPALDDKSLPFRSGKYSESATEATYKAIFKCAERCLFYGNPVVLDAAFSQKRYRKDLRELARKYQVPGLIANCSLDYDKLRDRLKMRETDSRSLSDGRVELLDKHIESFEPLDSNEGLVVVEVDTEASLESQFGRVLSALKDT
ncbi:MAG: AAA family ATPase [Deltaproteobacteria bacterium]|nr:AAA family ATPase [Deltaproteobacteria bacterium]